jgi:hypothetical protein
MGSERESAEDTWSRPETESYPRERIWGLFQVRARKTRPEGLAVVA